MRTTEEITNELVTILPPKENSIVRRCFFGYIELGTWIFEGHIDSWIKEFKDVLTAVINEARQEMIEHGIGDIPSMAKWGYNKDVRDELEKMMKNMKGTHVDLRAIWQFIKYLEARIALLCQEQGVNEIWQEGHRAGLFEGVVKAGGNPAIILGV